MLGGVPQVQLFVLTVIGTHRVDLLSEVLQHCTHSGCGVEKLHASQLGSECVLSILLWGQWSMIAKLEATLPALSNRLGVQILGKRTTRLTSLGRGLCYTAQVLTVDRPGAVWEVASFFSDQGFPIQEAQVETGAIGGGEGALSCTLLVFLSESVPIAGLREQFMLYCEERNLDASLEPHKFW